MQLYYCPVCDLVLDDSDTSTVEESDTSEFQGAREITAQTFIVCGHCGGDVEDHAPGENEELEND